MIIGALGFEEAEVIIICWITMICVMAQRTNQGIRNNLLLINIISIDSINMTKKVYKKKPRKQQMKKRSIVRVNTRNQMPVPMQIKTAFVMEFAGLWDTVSSGIVDPYLQLNGNTLIPSASSGPLLSGTGSGPKFYSGGGGFNIGAGTCPTGFQNYFSVSTSTIGLYSRYTVTGIRYSWIVNPQDNASQSQIVVTPEVRNSYTDNSSYTTTTEMQNAPYARDKRVTGNNTVRGNTISGYIDFAKFLGISRTKLLTDTSYSGYVTSSGIVVPAVPINITFAVRNNLGVPYITKLPYGLNLKYYVTFNQQAGRLMGD